MARRGASGPPAIDLAVFGDAFLRLAGAIVLETLAFVVWNVGTRSPLAVVRDARAALRVPQKLFAGIVCLAIGAIFVTAAAILVLPALVDPPVDFLPAELFTLLVALALEHLIGNDVRALAAVREERPGPG